MGRPKSVQQMMDEFDARRAAGVPLPKRPPPPARFEKRPSTLVREARLPPPGMRGRERVTAAQVRPNDWLVTNLGPLRIGAVEQVDGRVRLLSHGSWWSVPLSTRFVRIRRSRAIEMRPDLRKPTEEEQ